MDGESLVYTQKISVHLDCIDVPGHFCFCERNYSPQVLEETSGHLLVEVVQIWLDFTFRMFNYLDDVLCIFTHIFSECKLFLDGLLLVELNVSWFKEMSSDGDVALDLSFSDSPFWCPLSSYVVRELNVFACYCNMHIKRIFRKIHED